MWKEKTYFGLDLSSNQMALVRARKHREHGMELLGGGRSPLLGFRRGLMINPDLFVSTLRDLLNRVTGSAKRNGGPITVGLGGHVCQVNRFSATVPVSRGSVKTVDQLGQVLEEAAARQLGATRQIVATLPVHGEMVLDQQTGETLLEAEAIVISAEAVALQQLADALREAGLAPASFIYAPIQRARVLTSEEERDFGVSIVHMGTYTSTVMRFQDGLCQYCEIYPAGTDILASDLAYMLQIGQEEARRLFEAEGSLDEDSSAPEHFVTLPTVGGRPKRVAASVIHEILRTRMVELLIDFKGLLAQSGGSTRNMTVVSGNITTLPGLYAFARRVLDMPVGPGSVPDLIGDATALDDPRLLGALGACMTFPDLATAEDALGGEARAAAR